MGRTGKDSLSGQDHALALFFQWQKMTKDYGVMKKQPYDTPICVYDKRPNQ